MNYLLIPFLILLCNIANAQHWPTYQFQHDTIYKNAKVKSFQWREDSTRKYVSYEAEFDENGRIVKLYDGYPSIYYSYNSEGVLIGETDWDTEASISYDSTGRVISKITYNRDSVLVEEVSMSYDPKYIRRIQYDSEGQLKMSKEYYFDTETTVGEYVIETPNIYGKISYNYLNTFNAKGQIIRTTNMTILGQADYEYLENGLLNTITITHRLGRQEGAPQEVQQITYTYY